MLKTLLVVGLGSFAGGILRYLVSKWSIHISFHSFPVGTFLANVLGCFAIGIFYAMFEKNTSLSPQLKLFLTVGFCGGFTTFSTFMNENFQFVKDGNLLYVALYTATSLFIGFLMLYLGHAFVKLF